MKLLPFFVFCSSDYTVVQDGRTLQDSEWQKFTLGLSNVTVPELTTDMIMMSNTELYAQPQASTSQPGDADGGVTEAVMKKDDDDCDDDGDVGEERQDVIQDQQSVCESNVSKPPPNPPEDLEPDYPQSQEEGDVVEMIPPSQENEAMSLNPEEIPFSLTQAVVDHVSQEQKECESAIQEVKVEEMDWRERASLQDEEPSHMPQRITQRAYHSEGGAIRNDVMARGRGTKSLGVDQDPTEKREQTSEGCAIKTFLRLV